MRKKKSKSIVRCVVELLLLCLRKNWRKTIKNDLRRPTHPQACVHAPFLLSPSTSNHHRQHYTSDNDALYHNQCIRICKGSAVAEIGLVFGDRVRLKLDQTTRGPFLLRWLGAILDRGHATHPTHSQSVLHTTAASLHRAAGCVCGDGGCQHFFIKSSLSVNNPCICLSLLSLRPHRSFPTYLPTLSQSGSRYDIRCSCDNFTESMY